MARRRNNLLSVEIWCRIQQGPWKALDQHGIHTVSGGARGFRLARPVEVVYDLHQDKLLAQDADWFRVTLPLASSALYFTGRRELIQSLNPDIAKMNILRLFHGFIQP